MSRDGVPDDERAVEAADEYLAGSGENEDEVGRPAGAPQFRIAEDAVESSALD